MDQRIQIFAVIVSGVMLLVVLELVRRRRLQERYALLWLFSAMVLLGLAIWRDMLDRMALEIGVAYAPSALFAVALVFVLLLLLHFSVAVSRLTDQTKVLAQRLALLEERVKSRDEAEPRRAAREAEQESEVRSQEVSLR